MRESAGPFPQISAQSILNATASRFPNRVAIIDGSHTITYRELQDLSDKFAAVLEESGIVRGDRVALLAPNCLEFEIAFFGILKAGACVTTINSGYRKEEIAFQINESGARILVAHTSLSIPADSMPSSAMLERLILIDPDSAAGTFWDLIEKCLGSALENDCDLSSDLAALPFSSGTTGLQKGVMLTHSNLVANVLQYQGRIDEASVITEKDIVLVHLPLFHIYGMTVLMLNSIHAGATQVMMGRFEMDLFLSLIDQHRITKLFTAPPVILGLSLTPLISRYDTSSLKMVMSGAAPLSADLQVRVAKILGCPVIQGYGLTETSPVTNVDFTDSRIKPGTIGPALPDTEERVVDLETGQITLGPGETGELLVRGPQVMKGYFNQPESTYESIDSEGWFRTGDIVTMDEDGYVTVRDRKKELIKYKGFQVAPAELEGILLEHHDVADAAVIPKEDPEAGEIPKAYVVLKVGAVINAKSLITYVAKRVATFKRIAEIEFTDNIPKNASGKLLRRVLVERERKKRKE